MLFTVPPSSIINLAITSPKTTTIQNGTLCFWSCNYPISMKRSELTNQQKLLVPCPIRCRPRRALSDVFRLWSAQQGTLGAEILRHPSHRTWLWSGRVAPHVYPGKRSHLAGVRQCGQVINCRAIVGREHAAMGS
jgi:hypothetical protein